MYADKITDSMQRTIDETNRRRAKQKRYNEEHGITPTQITKKPAMDLAELYGSSNETTAQEKQKRGRHGMMPQQPVTAPVVASGARPYVEEEHKASIAADPVIEYMTPAELQVRIEHVKSEMVAAAKRTDFIEAAQLRDELIKLSDRYEAMTGKETEVLIR
jgi:excinuclease ABC subunit B